MVAALLSQAVAGLVVFVVSACTGQAAPRLAEKPAESPGRATSGEWVTSSLLRAASGGDGDSWRDTAGREYRLGLVNTPERGECYGSQATARRKELVAAGFRVVTYTTDRYGRAASVVTTADGTNLNVSLARNGYANDRYLEQYRQENPRLAGELDEAFAAAKHERAGVWGACTHGGDPSVRAPTPPPTAAPEPESPSATASLPGVQSGPDLYSSCSQARAQGAAPMRRGEPGNRSELDADRDGVACQ